MQANDNNIKLREIHADTLSSVLNLKVNDNQKIFVASNAESLAEALFEPAAWYRAIYYLDEVVGFVMLADESQLTPPPEKPSLWLWRFMIDSQYQKKGIGRVALQQVISHVRNKGVFDTLQLSYSLGPECPENFYLKLGFRHTGRLNDGEVVLELPLI
jgi:diamine N-acetyltransferase